MVGLGANFAPGWNQLLEAQVEATFGDNNPTWAAADSVQILGGQIEPNEDQRVRMDKRRTRSAIDMIRGPRDTNWSTSSYNLPPGGATPPDIGPLLTAALGTETIGGSDVTYTCAETPPSLALRMTLPGNFSQATFGAVCEELKLSVADGDEPKWEFNGQSAETIYTSSFQYTGAVDGTGGGGLPSLTVGAAGVEKFETGSEVLIGTSGPHRINTINATAIAFTPNVLTDEGTDPVITPYTAWAVGGLATAAPTPSISGQVTLGGVQVYFQELELTVKNNWGARRGALQQDNNAFIPGRREVTGSMKVWLTRADATYLMRSRAPSSANNPEAISILLGVAGSPNCVINLPRSYVNYAPVEIPEAEVATFTLPFTCLATSQAAADDEINIVFSSN